MMNQAVRSVPDFLRAGKQSSLRSGEWLREPFTRSEEERGILKVTIERTMP